MSILDMCAVGCFVRGALPGQPVRCLGYGSWMWTIWGGVALLVERLTREVRSLPPFCSLSRAS